MLDTLLDANDTECCGTPMGHRELELYPICTASRESTASAPVGPGQEGKWAEEVRGQSPEELAVPLTSLKI